MAPKPLSQIARELIDAREDYDKKQAIKVAAETHRDRLQGELLDRLRTEKLDGAPLDLGPGYGKITATSMKTIRGKVFDLKVAEGALKKIGGEKGFLETKPRQKAINDLVKTCIENKEPIPDGIEFTEQPYIRITRRK